jgi:hypothetical protein
MDETPDWVVRRDKRWLSNELNDCEEKILKAVETIGRQLREIREKRLYKAADYETFESYLRQKWDMSLSRGNQLINAENVRDFLADQAKGDGVLLENIQSMGETQLRAVARIEPESRLEVVQAVVAEGKPTASKIEALAAKTGAIPASKIRQPKLKHICPKCGETF